MTKSEQVVEKQRDNDDFIMNYTDDLSESAWKKSSLVAYTFK